MARGAAEELARLRLDAVRQPLAARRDAAVGHAQDAVRGVARGHVGQRGERRLAPVRDPARRLLQVPRRAGGNADRPLPAPPLHRRHQHQVRTGRRFFFFLVFIIHHHLLLLTSVYYY